MRSGWGCHAVAVTTGTTVVAALQVLQLHIAILLGACVTRFVPAASAAGQRCTGYRFRDIHLKDVLLLVAKLFGIGGSIVDGRSVDHYAVLAAVHYCMAGPMEPALLPPPSLSLSSLVVGSVLVLPPLPLALLLLLPTHNRHHHS